jgi:hypothetical protein
MSDSIVPLTSASGATARIARCTIFGSSPSPYVIETEMFTAAPKQSKPGPRLAVDAGAVAFTIRWSRFAPSLPPE